MKYIGIVFTFLAMFLFVMPEDAESARIGRGSSFGSKSTFSTPAAKPPVTSNITNNSIGGANAGAAAGTLNRGSGMGMMGGMFGGLLAGSLIGSMLGGGAFAGGGLFDILLIGLFVYIAFRLFTNLRGQKQGQSAEYFNGRMDNYAEHSSAPSQEASVQNQHKIDTKEFIEGAKTAYNRLQSSWSKRDLNDIKIFTTKSVYAEIQKHFEEDPEPCITEVISLDAQINNIEKDNGKDRISVYFTCLIREGEDANAQNVTELWHFVREDEVSMWLVDGIQQV